MRVLFYKYLHARFRQRGQHVSHHKLHFGRLPNLSVSNIAINAALEFITNCPCDASLNADVTSNLPPIILSNWWTVTGPGTNYTNSGSGLSTGSLPPPTNGGTGTATFYVSYTTWTNSANSAPWCCTNTNSVQIPFNVLQLTLTNLAFTNGNHTVYQDANAQPYPSPQSDHKHELACLLHQQ